MNAPPSTAKWYFDVVSPYSYLHWKLLPGLRERLAIEPVPVLFAGLLKHWGTKGPAEVPSKRTHTYQHCVWTAQRHEIAFRMPPRHPFNPLAAQRLLVALGADTGQVEVAFDFVFAEGRDPEREWAAFAQALGAVDADRLVADPLVKQRLASNTAEAVAAGVFGVPTLALRGQLFWGSDTIAWVRAFLDDPDLFAREPYLRAAATEFGVARSATLV